MNRTEQTSVAKTLHLKNVTLHDPYWTPYVNLVRNTVIPYQWEALNDRIEGAEPSHAISNFRIAAGLDQGEFGGWVFQDTDLYKWLEAVGYSLALNPDEDLERIADEAIKLIAASQAEDGYINTYFTLAEPGNRWTNLMDCHEMYSAGHLIEAAVAYFQGTGKRELLEVAIKMADHIDRRFGPEPGKIRGYDGHQEIELALVKLYDITGEARYLKLASFLIEERGQEPSFFLQEWEARGRISHWSPGVVQKTPQGLDYLQAHKPVREQEVASGHAVRAVYMYTGMADLALRTGDESLLAACRRLWNNTVHKQMYINGSIGSTHQGEAFTFDYDLPNDTNYSETCASIGLIFFARRMLQAEVKGEYGDVMERALYNTVTAGMAGDGKHYFYVNPLEVWPEASQKNPDKHHIKAVRQPWYGCACCPPNVARLLTSLGQYIFTSSSDTLYTHLYIGSEASVELDRTRLSVRLDSSLPWHGDAALTIGPVEGAAEFTLAVRIPSWTSSCTFALNGEPVTPEIRNGYAYLKRSWKEGDRYAVTLGMQPHRVYANPNLRANAGRTALQRGPLVYCFEEQDNGAPLASLSLKADSDIREVVGGWRDGIVHLEAEGCRLTMGDDPEALYSAAGPVKQSVKLTAVPYTLWGNRTPGEMLLWIREEP
ncbi:glycoside hydrolase family 127 protein [Paenibacillus sp. HN-1]|uniref:glycoside hydrolase family 127 protein n=1 Tax=Paenibacillus TaxID=44249 RepID=UPI001CA8A0CD|nr:MULTISPECIES: beta-L-arabinofuranosidase domain-containing protein [Paenibacillus]MBY9080664.1 glycoside hydrolase family 127 protein [Paenibacillus sp. CGMCC 1.18879]MBY9085391.1 glycoside hydrolase family 127 protein [Paenibacillus sinensis]